MTDRANALRAVQRAEKKEREYDARRAIAIKTIVGSEYVVEFLASVLQRYWTLQPTYLGNDAAPYAVGVVEGQRQAASVLIAEIANEIGDPKQRAEFYRAMIETPGSHEQEQT